jgi:predicted PhzF superfamily epimerase YddE/YHI9
MAAVARLPGLGVIVTAPGARHDFVSRYFAPAIGIPEDPVTGSTHCLLIPYWAERLGKTELSAFQCSAQGGELFCRLEGERVKIGGQATAGGERHVDADCRGASQETEPQLPRWCGSNCLAARFT